MVTFAKNKRRPSPKVSSLKYPKIYARVAFNTRGCTYVISIENVCHTFWHKVPKVADFYWMAGALLVTAAIPLYAPRRTLQCALRPGK